MMTSGHPTTGSTAAAVRRVRVEITAGPGRPGGRLSGFEVYAS
jgi:hypothetical protein